MPLTYEEAAEGQIDDIRHLRDVVDFGMTRGCSKKTWRDKDAEGSDPQRLEADDQACSMNLYQDYYGGQDLQFEDPIRSEQDVDRVGNVNERPSDQRFQLDSNVYRRGNTVAHPKAEYYISGCIGGDDNAGSKLNDADAAAPGFMNYTNIAPVVNGTGERCQDRDDDQCEGTDSHCIKGLTETMCKPGLYNDASHSIGNLYFGSDAAGPFDTYVKSNSKYCDRLDNATGMNPQVARHYVRDSYKGDKGTDGADPEWETRRACCLGAGTFQQGQMTRDDEFREEYTASTGKRPMGAPCEKDDDCLDGGEGGTMFCHTEHTYFYKGSKETMPNREDVKLKGIKHPASFTCRRRCGPAGSVKHGKHKGNRGKFDDVDYDYGTTWIGTTFGDQKTIDDARLRAAAITIASTVIMPGAGTAIGAGIAEAINASYIGPMEETPQTYVSGANLNQFECGFQQRLWDKPGEKLYYKPVFERADKHDDRVEDFVCLDDGKRYEYLTVGSNTCYGDEKAAWGFMCQEKCGFGHGLEIEWEASKNPDWYKADGNYPKKKSEGYCDTDPARVVRKSKDGKENCENGFPPYNGKPGSWVVTDPGHSLDKSEYTDEHFWLCKERCLPDENPSSFGFKCKKDCSQGPPVKLSNGHIQIKKFEKLTQCPFGYDSNDSDAFWDKVQEAKKQCAGLSEELCTVPKQRRGKEDIEAKMICEACHMPSGNAFNIAAWEDSDICKRECKRYHDIPDLCEYVKNEETGEGFCQMKPMKKFADIYAVHNDFLSSNVNRVTSRKGDGARTIVLENERCFYAGFPDQCWQATTETDAYGTAMRKQAEMKGESFDPSDHRQIDAFFGMFVEDRECLPGWHESFPGVCAKDCEQYYRRGLKKVTAYCVEEEDLDEGDCKKYGNTWKTGEEKWIDDQIGGIVGYGYSALGCPDCVGVKESGGDLGACMERCNYTSLPDCPAKSEGECQVPGTGCRWNHKRGVCYDPTYKIEHEDAWFGLVCSEKCGTSLNHGRHAPKVCLDKNGIPSGETKTECEARGGSYGNEFDRPSEFCPVKGKCTQKGFLNRCYQPCASDQKQGVFDFLCQDSCERHMQDDPDTDRVEGQNMCLIRNAGVADANIFQKTMWRPAEISLFECRANGQMYFKKESCESKCTTECSRKAGSEAVTMNREAEAVLKKYGVSKSNMNSMKNKLKESAPYSCGGDKFFNTLDECNRNCSSDCVKNLFQCASSKEAFSTMGECKSNCSNSCSRTTEARATSGAVSSAKKKRDDARKKAEEQDKKDKEEGEKKMEEKKKEGEKKMEDARKEMEKAKKEHDKEQKENKNKSQKEAEEAKREANSKNDVPEEPEGGVMESGLGCAANGDGPRRPWFRGYRRVRQIGGICWEDAPDKCTKCENLIGGAKVACTDGQLLAANACQHGETEENVRMERLTNVCSRVITNSETKKSLEEDEGLEGVKKLCGKFSVCKWEDNECKVKEGLQFKVGHRVVVGSGVKWKKTWQQILSEESKKGMRDEHVQGVNRVHGLPYHRNATIVKDEGKKGYDGSQSYTIKFDDGKYAKEGAKNLDQCILNHTKEFEKGATCCSCDSGLWNDVSCADALESNAPNWGSDWERDVNAWEYDGIYCKMSCPKGTIWESPSFYCNQTCDNIISSTKKWCNQKTGSSNSACKKHKWKGLDGSKHIVCRHKSGNKCESVFQGEWKDGIIPGACYKQGPEVTKERGKNYGYFGLGECEDDHGKHNCNWTSIGVFEGCGSKYGKGQWVNGFAPGLCYRVEPRDFSAASMGGAVEIAQWFPTMGKRAFIPKTHIKANYGPKSWMRSTYPKMRFKPSFFPVQRPRRSYAPRLRVKSTDPRSGYETGKARKAWWWDKQQTDSADKKACRQGCADPLGQKDITEGQCSIDEKVCNRCCKGDGKRVKLGNTRFPDVCGENSIRGVWDSETKTCSFPGAKDDDVLFGPRGCTVIEKDEDKSLYKRAKRDGGYTYPPLCRAEWTPGKPNLGFLKPFVCNKENSPLDGKAFNKYQMCVDACKGGECTMIADMDMNDLDTSPSKRVAVSQWVNACGEFFVGNEEKDKAGKNKGGWCMEYVEESARVAFDGLCMGPDMKAPEGQKENIYCQKSKANCEGGVDTKKRGKNYTIAPGAVSDCEKDHGKGNCNRTVIGVFQGCKSKYGDEWSEGIDPGLCFRKPVVGCNGVWYTNMKKVARDNLETDKIFPEISGLGEVVGYTRSDKDVLLLPFSLPRGVRVGVDDNGEAILREILLTMDDAGREKVFRVAKRSLAYDRREAATCDAAGVQPIETVDEASEEQCEAACNANDQCAAFDWNVQNVCRLYGKNFRREEDASMSHVCSVMKKNPHLAKNEIGQAIGYDVRIEPAEGFDAMENELNLYDVKDDVEGTPMPMPYEKVPGGPKKIGIMGTKNSYRMRRYQASAIHGGDICRNWLFDKHGNAEEILNKEENSALYNKVCNDFKEDCPSGDCSILNDAIAWCNTRVDSSRANSDLEVQLRLEKEKNFHTWTDGKCSDPSITSKGKGVCEGTRRKDSASAGQDNAQKLQAWRDQQMLEDIPRCLPDTFSAFDVPPRACPRWTADGAQGNFCRKLKHKYPLQYDKAIHDFCKNPDNALLPACDCLSADVVATERRDTDNASIDYCTAASGAEKADNYADRRQFCQTKQMLSQGSSGIGGEMNNHKFSFYEKCMTTIDAPHILKPKVVLAPDTMTCRADHESLEDFCGMKKSGCVAVEKPTKICMNVVEQFIGNCIIGAGDGPCGVIDNVQQQNNCCDGDADGCKEYNRVRTSVQNKVMLNPTEADVLKRTAPILPNADGIYRCKDDGALFAGEEDCLDGCPSMDCVKAYQKNAGSTFATALISDMAFAYDPVVEDPALTAAKKCSETEGCTGFVFDKVEEDGGSWLQYTLVTDSPAMEPRHGATAFAMM